MVEAFLGLGSNLGDKTDMIERALERLDAIDGVALRARSAFYRTPPWGDTNQDWFVNAAARIETTLAPHELLKACLDVERSLGRIRDRKWGPRSIDIDILVYGQVSLHVEGLTLPHPHLMERAFVLRPLADLAPDLVVSGRSVEEALAQLDITGVKRLED